MEPSSSNAAAPVSPQSGAQKSGPRVTRIVLVLIILALLGGLYAFMRAERTEAPTYTDTMEPLSRSDELPAIEKDLNTTRTAELETDLEADLNAADAEIDAALKSGSSSETTGSASGR